MFWLRACTVCLIMAAANHLLGFVPALETARWSCVICRGKGDVGAVHWTYNEDAYGVSLEVTLTDGSAIPEIPDGEYWKKDECYESIQKLVLTGITEIGARAFNNLKNLETIEAASVVTLRESAFEGSRVTDPNALPLLSFFGVRCFAEAELSGAWTMGGEVTLQSSVFEGSTIQSLDLSGASGGVRSSLLKNCKFLTTFIGGNMPDLPDAFFDGCEKLTGVNFTTHLESVGERAFAGCSSLKITFKSEDVTSSIGGEAFAGSGVTMVDLTVHANSFSVDSYAFKDCRELETVHCPSLTTIEMGLFQGCIKLSKVTLNESLRSVRHSAFANCSSLQIPFVSGSVEFYSIELWAFRGSGITSLDLSVVSPLFSLDQYAFADCKSLKTIVLPENLTELPIGCFAGCGVTSIEIPATVTEFGTHCFQNCKSLTSVTYLGYAKAYSDAFEGCDAVKHVTVPDDYPYDDFGGLRVRGLSLGAKIGIGVGVAAFVIIVIVVVVVVLFVTGKIGGKKRDSEAVDA